MTPIEQWRTMIDEIDDHIINLIGERKRATEEILKLRLEDEGTDFVRDYDREKEVREKYEPLSAIYNIGGAIMEACSVNHVGMEIAWVREHYRARY